MLIGIDARYGFRRERRGIGCYIYNLLQALEKMALDERFVLYVDSLAVPELVRRFSRPPFVVRVLNGTNLFWWEQVLLPAAARRDRVDVLHCTSNIAPLLKVCPTVLTIHDMIEFRRASFGDVRLRFRHRISRLYRVSLLPRLARSADKIVTDSEFSKGDIAEVLNIQADKISVTYLSLPEEMDQLNGSYPVLEGRYIFALGALDRRKNIEVLLKAFSILKSEGLAGVKLVIAGVENLELFRKNNGLDEHPYKDDIVCRGFVSNAELSALYRHCACFVYPSLYEGFGLPPLEAMAAGAPVIASQTTSVGEIVGEAGLLFDPNDPLELAAKIKSLIVDPGLAAELRTKGLKRLQLFSWEKCARETLEVYREVHSG
ncbi:MAG: glycosyltransferase family 4 protein [Pelotomaculum sp.]|nr:glycosyltransferase family 4 protein [Pelotomaculum sp.]